MQADDQQVGGVQATNVEGVAQRNDTLVCRDRDRARGPNPRQRLDALRIDRLLHDFDVEPRKLSHHAGGPDGVPAPVRVETQAFVGSDGGPDPGNDLSVQIVAPSHLDVDHFVARGRQPRGLAGDFLGGFALRETEVAHLVAHCAAQQSMNGAARRLAHGVPQRHLEPRERLACECGGSASLLTAEQPVVGLANQAGILERTAPDAKIRREREMGADGLGRWRRNRLAIADHALVGVDLDQDHLGAVGDPLGPVKGLLVGDPERRRDDLANLHVLSCGARRLRSPQRSLRSQAPHPAL